MIEKYIEAYITTAISCMEAMFAIACTTEGEERFKEESTFSPINELTINIPFSGAISGDYFFSVKENEWVEYLTNALGDGSTEMVNSCLKELHNTIIGSAIQPIQDDFSDLTFLSPRIYRGAIDYPATKTLSAVLTAEGFSTMGISLSLNLMKQDIGLKLDEALHESAQERVKAEKAEMAVQSIMNNIKQGIFNIDLNGVISPGCSKKLGSLLKKDLEDIEDKNFDDACPLAIIENRRGEMGNWLDFVKCAPETMSWSDLTDLAPFHEEQFSFEGQELIYNFVYHRVENGQECSVMTIIEDITEQRKAEILLEETKKQYESNMELLNTVLSLNDSELFSFLNECDRILNEVENLSNKTSIDNDIVNHLFRSVHSLKGGAATLNFNELSAVAHKVEDYLDELRHASADSDKDMVIENISSIKGELNNIYTVVNRLNIKKIEDIGEKGQSISVQQSALEEIIQSTDKLSKLEIKKELEKLLLIPLSSYETTLKPMVDELSNKLNKKAIFAIQGECLLPPEVFHRLSNPIIHLIRNSVDHGIESPEIREQANKNSIGTITLSASFDNDTYTITLTDDGSGIQTSTLKKAAIAKEIISADQQMSQSELEMLIFHPGFSTKKQVSDISGRGVGLDSVKATVEELGGEINVHNNQEKGTSFVLKIPTLTR